MPLSAELVEQLRAFPALLEAYSRRVDRARWAERPSPREFAMVEHACHLRDFEIEGCQLRVRRMLAEESPELADFDGLAIAAERDYLSKDGDAALAAFARAREETLARVAALTDAELARSARFAPYGVITIPRLLALLAEHDTSHRAELDQLVGKVGGGT